MKKIKLAVVGCLGRMGKEIIKEINNNINDQKFDIIDARSKKRCRSNFKRIGATI